MNCNYRLGSSGLVNSKSSMYEPENIVCLVVALKELNNCVSNLMICCSSGA